MKTEVEGLIASSPDPKCCRCFLEEPDGLFLCFDGAPLRGKARALSLRLDFGVARTTGFDHTCDHFQALISLVFGLF